jgi:glycerol-3-phosphate O-acyltransferase
VPRNPPADRPRSLRAFLEAYGVVADRLESEGSAAVEDEAAFLRECLAWGKQYVLQRRIRSPESVSKMLLENGLKLARNRGLLDSDEAGSCDSRQRFARELRETIRRVDAIEALASARRAGLLA